MVVRVAEDRADGEIGAPRPPLDAQEAQLTENEVERDAGGASLRASGLAVSGPPPRASPVRMEETLG